MEPIIYNNIQKRGKDLYLSWTLLPDQILASVFILRCNNMCSVLGYDCVMHMLMAADCVCVGKCTPN